MNDDPEVDRRPHAMLSELHAATGWWSRTGMAEMRRTGEDAVAAQVVRMLLREDHDGITSLNGKEDPGSLSWVIPFPWQARIVASAAA